MHSIIRNVSFALFSLTVSASLAPAQASSEVKELFTDPNGFFKDPNVHDANKGAVIGGALGGPVGAAAGAGIGEVVQYAQQNK